MPDYEQIYRKMHPKRFPYSPYEKQRELCDLWPDEQEKFKREVDTILDYERTAKSTPYGFMTR